MRYFIGFLVTIGLIILLIVLLFGGGNGGQKTPSHKTLTSYADTGSSVRMTLDGPVNADQNHDQIQINVDKEQVTFKHLKGYDGSVIEQHTYANTENAYNNFLHALAAAGFSKGDNSPTLRDERGYCALGDRYIFELVDNGDDVERYWSTSCGNPKTYGGDTSLTLQLFENQVPQYNDLIQNVQLL